MKLFNEKLKGGKLLWVFDIIELFDLLTFEQLEYLGNNLNNYSLKQDSDFVYSLFKKKFAID